MSAIARPRVFSVKELAYLGKVAEWLKSAPEDMLPFTYSVEGVTVAFDGITIGFFRHVDDYWQFEPSASHP